MHTPSARSQHFFEKALSQLRCDNFPAVADLALSYCGQRSLLPHFPDVQDATIHFLERAAIGGHPHASLYLGLIFAADQPQRSSETPYLWRLAAEGGDPLGAYYYGRLLISGWPRFCVDKEISTGLHWLTVAAQAGHLPAMWYLGHTYAESTEINDPVLAAVWYEEAARAGDGESQFALGELYEAGRGVGQNFEMAMSWYGMAAMQRIHAAQLKVGEFLESGRVGPPDFEEAARWYRLVADREDKFEPISGEACFRAGWLLESGEMTAGGRDEAFDYYRRAATAEHRQASVRLFELHQMGEFDPAPEDDLMRWTRTAAEEGDRQAMFQLGTWAEADSPLDVNEAVRWYRAAANTGHAEALLRLVRLSAMLR